MRSTNRYADLLPLNLDIRSSRPLDRTPIKPVQAGYTLPLFHLYKEDFVVLFSSPGRESSYVVGSELLHQPLVLAFFSIHWNDRSLYYLKALQSLYADIQVMGGQLLVVSGDGRKELEALVAEHGLTFPLAIDRNYQIAGSAGIYADTDPLWNRISGIEENAPLPAMYVVDQFRRITYAFTDHYLNRAVNVRELLTEVYTAGQAQALSRAIA